MSSESTLIYKAVGCTVAFFLFLLILFCPCKRLMCCHLKEFWLGVAALMLVIIVANKGFKLTDPTCRPS